nr:hypothetical protein [Roseobacter litoralis]
MMIFKELLDKLLNGVENADDLLGDQGLMKELEVRLMERILGEELTEHLGYEPDTQSTNRQSRCKAISGSTRLLALSDGESCFFARGGVSRPDHAYWCGVDVALM